MIRNLSYILIHYRGSLLIGYFIITAFFFYNTTRLQITTIFSDLFPYTHPYVKLFQKYGDSFGTPLSVYIVLEVKKGDIFNVDTLHKVQRITQGLDAIPGVNHNQVISITSPRVKRVEAIGEGIQVRDLIGRQLPSTVEELEDLRRSAAGTEGVTGILVSQDARATLITANFLESRINYRIVFEDVNEILQQEQDAQHNLYAAGQPILTGWVHYYQREMYSIFGLGLLIMITLLAFYFRNIAGTFTPIIVGSVSAIWGFGFAALFGYNFDPLIIVVPVLLVARALSHSVQMCERYFEIYNRLEDTKKAATEALNSLSAPGLLSIFTDAAGLFVIAISPIPLIEKLAYMCGWWALSLIFSAVFLTPVILSYLPPPRNAETIILSPDRKGMLYKLFGVIAYFSSSRRLAYSTVGFFTCITLLSVWWSVKLDIGHATAGSPLLWPNSFYNVSVKKINNHFRGSDELNIVVEGAIKEPQVLKKMLELQYHMERSPKVAGTLSVVDYLMTVSKYLNGGNPKWGIIPDDRRWVSSLYLMLLPGSNPGDWDRYFTPDFRNANIIVWYKDHSNDTVKDAIRTAKEFVDPYNNTRAKDAKFRLASGSVGLAAATNELLGRLEVQTILLISLCIFVVTSFVYRSFVAGVLLVVIANIANLMTAAVMHGLGIGLDVNTLPIASVGMGIGIDYNIYFMSRLAEEYRRTPNYEKVLPVAVFTTGKAIFFTASTMVAGIFMWYFMSSLRFQAEMGLLLTIVMLAHVILALVFQAAVIRILQPKFVATGGIVRLSTKKRKRR